VSGSYGTDVQIIGVPTTAPARLLRLLPLLLDHRVQMPLQQLLPRAQRMKAQLR
jgi:hypothetical protein